MSSASWQDKTHKTSIVLYILISSELCWVKKSNLKKLHIIEFYVYNILKIFSKQRKINNSQELRMAGKGSCGGRCVMNVRAMWGIHVTEGRALYLKCSEECTNLPMIKLDTHVQRSTSKREEPGISRWCQCQYPDYDIILQLVRCYHWANHLRVPGLPLYHFLQLHVSLQLDQN